MDSRDSKILDTIVDEILRGERMVLFPPGALVFVIATVSLQMGAALVAASSFPPLLFRQGIHAGMAQMLGLVSASAFVCLPAILVALGRSGGYAIVKHVVHYALGVSVLLTIASLTNMVCISLTTLVIATFFVVVSNRLVSSISYRTFSTFKRRLRERRQQARTTRNEG